MFHAPAGFASIVNVGELAIINWVVFFLAAQGPAALSIDQRRAI